jgi:hypothetical protein
MTLAVLLLLVGLACGIVLAVVAIIRRDALAGVGAVGLIVVAWAGLLLAGVHLT